MDKKCTRCKIVKNKGSFYPIKTRHGKSSTSSHCKDCTKISVKNYRESDRGRTFNRERKVELKRRYNMTLEQYDDLLKIQKHACAICLIDSTEYRNKMGKYLAVDHCHSTGTIRGLLCDRCNKMLGHIDDSVEVVDRIKEYLLKEKKAGQ